MIQLDYGVWLVTRAEWGARAPTSVTGLSVDTDTDHWGGGGFGAPFPHSSCPAKVRAWQNYHMDVRGWTDLAYNAVACPHGFLFEGRGRGRRSAANGTTAGNSGSYATCYLGGEGDEFTEAGRRAMRASGNWLTRAGSRRLGHRDWKSTACPGDVIYAWVHAGQPITGTIPTPTPVPKELPLMYAIRDDGDTRPWAVCADNGDISMFGPPARVAVFLQPGDHHRPDEEFWSQAKAGAFAVEANGWPRAVTDREWDNCCAATRERREASTAATDLRVAAIHETVLRIEAAVTPPPP